MEFRTDIRDNTGIILAPDIADFSKIKEVANAAAPHIDGIKFHFQEHGDGIGKARIIKRSVNSEHGFVPYIMADEKLADIPPRNAAMVRNYSSIADGITVHAFPGPFSLESAILEANNHEMDVLVVCAMTQPGAPITYNNPLRPDMNEALKSEFTRAERLVSKGKMNSEMVHDGYEAFVESIHLYELKTMAEYHAAMAMQLGARAIIGPGNQVDILSRFREIIGPDIEIWSPGLIDQEGNVHEAFQYVNRGIIGGGIYYAEDPAKAAEDIAKIIENARKERG